MAQTLEQKRAKFALEKVKAVAKQDNKTQGKYRSRLLNLGTQIHQNGLGQTMAFYLSKSGPEAKRKGDKEMGAYRGVYTWLGDWLCGTGDDGVGIYRRQGNNDGLINWITGEDASKYRMATLEIMELVNWLKRFASALLASGEDNEDK